MKNFTKQKNKGFTLVETLVAISVFTMSVLTLVIVLAQGITSTNYAKQKIIAEYLAQEGIEYARNIRDTNVINASNATTGWTNFKTQIANCLGSSCYLNDDILFNVGSALGNALDTTYIACTPTCPKLKYDLASNSDARYNHTYGDDSVFTSTITMTQVNADEIKVSSTVSWDQGSGPHSITLSDSLFNWIE